MFFQILNIKIRQIPEYLKPIISANLGREHLSKIPMTKKLAFLKSLQK